MEDVRGQLVAGALPEVLRHIAFLRESGRLHVTSDAGQGAVVMRDGRPVHAHCRRRDGSRADGMEAVATMLRWSDGHYAFGRSGDDGEAGNGEGPVRNLVGDTETILAEARSRVGHKNGRLGHASPGTAATASARATVEPPPPIDPATRWQPPTPAAAAAPVDPGFREEPRIRRSAVLVPVVSAEADVRVTVSHVALDLWRRLDGQASLTELAVRSGVQLDAVRRRAEELVAVGLARPAPQAMYGRAFVVGLIGAMNEIMGPMGEILVEEALLEQELDPRSIPQDRIEDLTTSLTRQLRRSDWQMKLRARVARLRADTVEKRPEETA